MDNGGVIEIKFLSTVKLNAINVVYITTTQILVTKDNPSHLLYCIMIIFKSHTRVLHIYKCKCVAVHIKCTGRSTVEGHHGWNYR